MDLRGELIGLDVEVAESRNRSLAGVKGRVADETRNLFVLEDGRKLVREQVVLLVDGERVDGRSEERVRR